MQILLEEVMDLSNQITTFTQENEQFLSRIYSSKEEFLKKYERLYNDITKSKQLLFQILFNIKKVILEGNVESFKRFIKLLGYLNDTRNRADLISYRNEECYHFKNTNIIILACKYNQTEVLKYILDNFTEIFNNSILTAKTSIVLPSEKDEACHDAFYYSIRSGNIELLETLINKWPNNYLATHQDELDDILSRSYEELLLKNVLLSENVKVFVENKLLNLRFFSIDSKKVKNNTTSLTNIKERIEFVLENISLLTKIEKVGEKFIFIAKCIAQNIHVLKRQLKFTYDRLPWEEIEFCLVIFVSCYVKRQEINLYFQATLSKTKILKYLTNFAKKLGEERNNLNNEDINKFTILPKISRDKNITQIIDNNPQFKEMYNVYQWIRDIHSLEKISNYINLTSSADPTKREGQLIILRCLQVLGEYLKNTLESPKLSNVTSELILLSLPANVRKVIIDLRNALSHSYSLSRRLEIEKTAKFDFFTGIQHDIKEIGSVIDNILHDNKAKTVKFYFKEIINSVNLNELSEFTNSYDCFKLASVLSENSKSTDFEKLEKLIKKLKMNIPVQTEYEHEIFKRIDNIIEKEKSKKMDVKHDGFVYIVLLISISRSLSNPMDSNQIRVLKHFSNSCLQNMNSTTELQNLEEIAQLSVEVYYNSKIKTPCDLYEIDRIVYEILRIVQTEKKDMKWVNDLREKLNQKNCFLLYKRNKIRIPVKETYQNHLRLKLTELKTILSNDASSNKPLKFAVSKNNVKLQAAIEILILDILSLLGSFYKYLEDNLCSLDDNTPLLIGKNLRNHLAHDNTLIEILLSDPSIALFLNAQKINAENLILRGCRSRSIVPTEFRNSFSKFSH